jgi:hypothetical protein
MQPFHPLLEPPGRGKNSKAPQFAKPVGITARFSLGGGNPQAPDNAEDNVRGLAVRFDNGNGAIHASGRRFVAAIATSR